MSDMHDPYDDQLRSARYKAERDQARQECERLRRKVECLGDDIENLKLELGEAKDRLRDSVPREAYERKRATWLLHIRECEEALRKRNRRIKELEGAALERRTVREEDREAVEWVRDHGGLDVLEAIWDNDVPLANGVISALWPDERPDDCGNERVMDELCKRLMPEGMEWPRYDTGEPLKLDDEVAVKNCEPVTVRFISFDKNGFSVRHTGGCREHWFTYGERVKRPAPKVLDADGVEIRVGDTVYGFAGQQYEVTGLCEYEPSIVHAKTVGDGVAADELLALSGQLNSAQLEASKLTHRAPVPAADGKPLRDGETVYHVNTGIGYSVRSVTNGGAHLSKGDKPGGYCRADYLTHERPVADTWERLEEDARGISHDISWNLGNWSPSDFKEADDNVLARIESLIPRAKALADRSEK